MLAKRIKSTIREVKDFPKPGISYKDITPIMQNVKLCKDVVDGITNQLLNQRIDAVVGIDAGIGGVGHQVRQFDGDACGQQERTNEQQRFDEVIHREP